MNAELSAIQTQQRNASAFMGFEMTTVPKSERFIYIYTVSKRTYVAHTGAIKNLPLRGVAAGERWALCAEIPDPFWEGVEIVESGRRRPEPTPGLWIAQDIVNPDNRSGNQDLDLAGMETGEGQNLNVRGVFWSLNNPPLEEELLAAEARLTKRKQALADKVLQTARSSPKDLQYVLNEESREALDDLGIETDFHKRPTLKVACPNCAEMIAATAKFHRSEMLQQICVLPNAEAWKAAVRAGVKKADDVPDEFREKRGVGRPQGS